MQRVMTFVNGSNLFTAFKHLDLYIDDYEDLYFYVFEQAVEWWRSTLASPSPPPAQHVRVYWHVVDTMDEWDLTNPKTRQHLIERFQDDRELHGRWMAEAAHKPGGTEPGRGEGIALNLFLEDCHSWYEKRQSVLGGMNRFHHAVEAATDIIELCRCGRWKVDLLHKVITERGLDVCFAVNSLALADSFDLAILIGGDPDGVASVEHLKSMGKQVAVVELLKGHASEFPGRGFATALKLAADFVIPIYEMDLVKRQIATRGTAGEAFVLKEAS